MQRIDPTVYACMCIYVRTYVCMYVCMYVCLHVLMADTKFNAVASWCSAPPIAILFYSYWHALMNGEYIAINILYILVL